MNLVITQNALDEIKNNFDTKKQELIFNKLERLEQNYETLKTSKNIEKIEGLDNVSRYKISSSIRAIFIICFVEQDGEIIVLSVIERENAYTNKQLKRYKKLAEQYRETKND